MDIFTFSKGEAMRKSCLMLLAAILVLCSLFNICAFAAGGAYKAQNSLGIEADGGTLRQTDDGVSLTIEKVGASARFAIDKDKVQKNANSLSIVMSNHSFCNTVTVGAEYKDGSSVYSELDISKSGRKTYTLPIENCESIDSVTMNFGSTVGGEIIFYSIFANEVFDEEKFGLGEISACTLSQGKLILKGSMRHDAVIKHQKDTLSVFALGPGQDFEDIYSGSIEPIAENIAMTIRFELSASFAQDSANLLRYVVAVNSSDGLLPVCAPVYPDIGTFDYNINFKGIETNVISGVLESGAGLATVELKLSDIVSEGNYGYMVTLDDNRYFFNREYISELDSKIKTLSGSSCDVFIRFSEMTAVYTMEEQMRVYALVKFLSGRYSTRSMGIIKGYIIGNELNEKITEGKTFSEYIDACYCLSYTVASAASSEKNPAAVVFSVSDSWGTEASERSVSAEMFITYLFSVLEYYDAPLFAIMPELRANPYGINDTYISQNGGNSDVGERDALKLQKSSPDCDYIAIDNFNRFFGNYIALLHKHAKVAPKLIFSWIVDENTSKTALTASYVYGYYTMFFSEYVSAFIVSFKDSKDDEVSRLNDLRYKMRYMDTEKSAEAGELAKSVFGLSDWADEIENFDPKALKTRAVKDSLNLAIGASKDVFGTYKYWDFSANSSHSGWYSGVNCESLSVESHAGDGRALVAKMTVDSKLTGEYAFFAYTYESKESFKYNDYLMLEFSLLADDMYDNFDMKITLGGEGFLYEYNATDLVAGTRYTACLDIRGMTEKELLEYIRIGTKNSTNGKNYSVKLYSVTAASAKYSNEDLTELIRSEKDRILGLDRERTVSAPSSEWIIIAAIAVIATAFVMVMLSRAKKNARPEDRAD